MHEHQEHMKIRDFVFPDKFLLVLLNKQTALKVHILFFPTQTQLLHI